LTQIFIKVKRIICFEDEEDLSKCMPPSRRNKTDVDSDVDTRGKAADTVSDIPAVLVKFKRLDGVLLECHIRCAETVWNIKHALQKFSNQVPEELQLVHSGRALADDNTLRYYDVQSGDVIHIVLNLRGD